MMSPESREPVATDHTAATLPATAPRSTWRLVACLSVVLVAILAVQQLRPPATRNASHRVLTPPPGDTPPTGESVSLTIDFGDGKEQHFSALAWSQGMTVAHLLALAQQQAAEAAELEIVVRGSGEAAFLQQIGTAANQGAAGRNWTYSINGQPADRSFAVYDLAPDDRVLWTFAAAE